MFYTPTRTAKDNEFHIFVCYFFLQKARLRKKEREHSMGSDSSDVVRSASNGHSPQPARSTFAFGDQTRCRLQQSALIPSLPLAPWAALHGNPQEVAGPVLVDHSGRWEVRPPPPTGLSVFPGALIFWSNFSFDAEGARNFPLLGAVGGRPTSQVGVDPPTRPPCTRVPTHKRFLVTHQPPVPPSPTHLSPYFCPGECIWK